MPKIIKRIYTYLYCGKKNQFLKIQILIFILKNVNIFSPEFVFFYLSILLVDRSKKMTCIFG